MIDTLFGCCVRSWFCRTACCILFCIGNPTLRAQQIQLPEQIQLSRLLPLPQTDTNAIKKRYRQSRKLLKENPDSAMLLAQQGLAASKKAGFTYGQGQYLLTIAQIESERGNLERALAWLRLAAPICRQLNKQDLWGNYYLFGAQIYNAIGDADTAIQLAHKALYLHTRYPQLDSAEIMSGFIYTVLGMIHMGGRHDPVLAISYLEKAKLIAERNGSRIQLPNLYAHLGGAWANSNNGDSLRTDGYQKGLGFYFKAEALARELNQPGTLVGVYLNVSGIYCNLDMPDSAAYYLDKLSGLPEQYINYHTKIAAQFIVAAGFSKKKNYPKAIRYFQEARSLSYFYHTKARLLDIEESLAEAYKNNGQLDKALAHLQAYSDLRDSLLNEEKIKATQQLETKFRVAEKDKELALKNERLGKQQSLLREKNIWIGAGGASSLLFVSLLVVWRRNAHHRRLRQEKEQQVYKQEEEIRNLNAMVKGEEKERARLGRELHDGIVSQLAAIKMNLDTLQLKYPIPEEEHLKVLHHLEDTVIDLRKTAHNLIPGVLLEYGLVMALESYCEKTAGFTGLDITFICQEYVPRMQQDFELSLYRMVQELVQNVIKHAEASRVLIQVDYHDPALMLTVEDNGTGFEPGKKSDGIGFSNLQSRVKALRGQMDIYSKEDRGTSVYLEFDLSSHEYNH